MQKVAVVTGGSNGIGYAIVKRLEAENYQVVNLDIQPSDAGHYIECDVSQVSAVKAAIEQVIAKYGRVDVLISNAGKHLSATIEDTSEAMLDELLALNVKGAFAAVQAVLPQMKQQQQGAIVLMASDQALIAKRSSFAYNLTKAALASMAKTTALDYAEYGIRCNAVCPGTIETPLYHAAIERYCQKSGRNPTEVHAEEAAEQPLGRLGQPEEVAALVSFLVSAEAAFITGSLQLIDGGYTAQ
ncbi:SDR family oxidoreductase [Alkalimonas collagenimarina]|uniref:SDR family oxidoreductase n=1 Tax=Alkalimonas collagenimarina TaxID=400390 RepID=A0ABT9H068_9GAMM|nr:SDR family oxidoreductase [Alkalimonas collagenimarina]MDP4536707.1 SDR family oxidoreductase [Alkalimonas collagenimarina]